MERVTTFDGELRARAPLALQQAVERAAAERYTTPSEIIRQAVAEAVRAGVIPGSDGGEEKSEDDGAC